MKKAGVLIILVFCQVAFSQNYAIDIKKCVAYIESQSLLNLNVRMKVFPTSTTKVPDVTDISLLRNGKKYYYQIKGIEMLLSESSMLMVNHSANLILIKDLDKKEIKKLNKTILPASDSVTQNYDSVRYEKTGTLKKYSLYVTGEPYTVMEVYLDAEEKMSKVVYWYNPGEKGTIHKAEIEYVYGQTDPLDPRLNVDNFVIHTANDYKGVGKCSSYEVHRQQNGEF